MRKSTLSNQALGRLCRSLALLLHSGISLADALYLLAKEEKEPLASTLEDMGRQMDNGTPFSDAVESSGMFPLHMKGMLHIGERTGKMEEALQSLADYYDAQHRVGKLLRNALAYPSLILMLMLLVIGVLLIKVLPVFDEVYASLGSRLTGLAAGLLHAGFMLEAALPVLLVILAVIVVAVLLFSLCEPFRKAVTGTFKKHFGDRGLLRKFNNARFAQALSMGLGSGLTLEDALDLSTRLLSDTPGAQTRCAQCGEYLTQGDTLPDALEKTGLLPAASSRMLAVGIRSGSGDLVIAQIARQMDEDAADALEAAVGRIEPAMVLLASVLVGVILLSVMLPLMNILSAIG